MSTIALSPTNPPHAFKKLETTSDAHNSAKLSDDLINVFHSSSVLDDDDDDNSDEGDGDGA